MVCLKENFVLMLTILLIVLGVLLLVEPCVAPVTVPANPKSGPEIASVIIHNTPIWEPPVTITNPYTGEVTSTRPGRWVQNGTIEITIKNRPFTSYNDENGNTINTYYCLFYNGTQYNFGWVGSGSRGVPIAVYQSDSTYTVIPFTYGDSSQLGVVGGDVCFRIQTVEGGYFGRDPVYGNEFFEGVGSKWTEFRITIPANDPYSDNNPFGTFKPNIKPSSVVPDPSDSNILPSSNPDPRAQISWATYLLIITATVCIITVPFVIVMYHNRHQQHKRKPKHHSNNPPNTQFTEASEVQK